MKLASIRTLRRDMRPGPKVWLIVADCPYCEKTHNHGGGANDLPDLGLRASDCFPGGSYEMVIDDNTIVNDGTGPHRVGGFEGWTPSDPGPRLNPRLSDLYDLWEASAAKRLADLDASEGLEGEGA